MTRQKTVGEKCAVRVDPRFSGERRLSAHDFLFVRSHQALRKRIRTSILDFIVDAMIDQLVQCLLPKAPRHWAQCLDYHRNTQIITGLRRDSSYRRNRNGGESLPLSRYYRSTYRSHEAMKQRRPYSTWRRHFSGAVKIPKRISPPAKVKQRSKRLETRNERDFGQHLLQGQSRVCRYTCVVGYRCDRNQRTPEKRGTPEKRRFLNFPYPLVGVSPIPLSSFRVRNQKRITRCIPRTSRPRTLYSAFIADS